MKSTHPSEAFDLSIKISLLLDLLLALKTFAVEVSAHFPILFTIILTQIFHQP